MEQAVGLLYANTGKDRFQGTDNLTDEVARKQLIEEINSEIPSPEDNDNLVKRFVEAQSYAMKLLSCGGCGFRNMETTIDGTYKLCKLIHLPIFMELTKIEVEKFVAIKNQPAVQVYIDDKGKMDFVEPWRAYSVYIHNDGYDSLKYYHLHPEMIQEDDDGDKATYLCPTCVSALSHRTGKEPQKPPLSLANGIDFGSWHRLNYLTEPNIIERHVLARVRHYETRIKVQHSGLREQNLSKHLRGHVILFGHDAPVVATELLNTAKKFAQTLQIICVGPEGTTDALLQHALGTSTLRARAYVIHQWLAVSQRLNMLFRADEELLTIEKFEEYAHELNDEIQQQAKHFHDHSLLTKEAAIGSDISKVPETENEQENDDEKESSFALENSSVSASDKYSEASQRASMEAIQRDFRLQDVKIKHPDANTNTAQSYRNLHPVNEFEENDFAIAGAFPTIFLFGQVYCSQGSLSMTKTKHLLQQFTNIPARSRELLLVLFDQKQRHAVSQGISTNVKGNNRKQFDRYVEIVKSDKFKKLLCKAIEKPNSKAPKRVMKIITPILNISGCEVPYGPSERSLTITNICAMSSKLGPASTFLTIAPNMENNPTALRLTMRSINNTHCPTNLQNDEAFFEAMENSREFRDASLDISIPLSYRERLSEITDNPVASALAYKRLVENVLTICLGLPPNAKKKGYYKTRPKGLFGHTIAYYGVHETQARNSSHCI